MITDKDIRTNILKNSLVSAKARLQSLIDSKAPSALISAQIEKVNELENGILKVAHIDELGNLEYSSFEVKTGRMGAKYISYTTSQGIINFFPNGKFGAFISKEK